MHPDPDELVHPSETLYFGIAVAFSALTYLALILSVVGIPYLGIVALIGLVSHGLWVGRVRGNGVRASEEQLPEVYRLTQDLARQMRLTAVPPVYVLEAGGFLNAFAARFMRRDFVLAAGKRLYRRLDPEVFASQSHNERGFWVWLSEMLSTHPGRRRLAGRPSNERRPTYIRPPGGALETA